jgi:lambda family phage tail tape measure protein
MAKTIDELTVKINVDGTAQLSDATTKMDNLGTSADKTGQTLKGSGQNIRNVSFQIQDMAVQIAGGTSAFVAMGQQLPQLLGGFGMWGAAIGAVAAVGIPLLRAGLNIAGVDMRNLQERTSALTDITQKYQDAQKQNAISLEGMGNQYGALTASAKAFYEAQEAIRKQQATVELAASIKEAVKQIDVMNTAVSGSGAAIGKIYMGSDFKEGNLWWEARLKTQALLLGLSTEQATELGKRMKDVDGKDPEKASNAIKGMIEYLQGSNTETTNLRRQSEKVIEPLLKINQALLDQKENLRNSAEQASNLSASMMLIQLGAAPDINAARRNFDQVTAIRKEGDLKYNEFKYQLEEKSAKDGANRDGELTAFRLKNQQEINDRIADYAKGQQEAYRAAYITNDTKLRQLQLEDAIVKSREKGMFDTEYNLKYDEAILQNAKTYSDTLVSLSEQRRKGVINAQQELLLRQEANDLQNKSNSNAAEARNSAVRIFMVKQEMEISKQAIEDQIARAGKLGDALRAANQKVYEARTGLKPEDMIGKNSLQKQIMEITQTNKRAAQEAARTFAESFGDQDLTIEKAQELKDGLDQIALAYKRVNDEQTTAATNSYDSMRTWSSGWSEAFAQYAEDATNSANQAQTIFSTFSKGFEDSIVKFVQTGKLSFKDLANSIIADIVRIQAKRLVLAMFGTAGGDGGLFGGLFRAAGGPVAANSPYIVGEKGPELFVPKAAGTIVPNDALAAAGGAGGSSQVTYNIQAVDASSFRQMIARDPEFLFNVTEAGRRSLPQRSRR